MSRPIRLRRPAALAALLGAGLFVLGTGTPAMADPVDAGTASAYGLTASIAGTEAIPPTPQQTADVTGANDATETLVEVPAQPLAFSGTATADAAAHTESDLESTLQTDGTTQEVAGPYNVRAVGLVENLDVLLDVPGEGQTVLSADAVRAEAVGVCTGDTVAYSANSEILNLTVADTPIPLNGPLTQIIDALSDALTQSGLNAVVEVQRNVVTENPDGGVGVDALVVKLLSAAGDPLVEAHVAHAEVNGLACSGPAAPTTQCNDGIDNDGDQLIDFGTEPTNDPGCESAEDDSEDNTPLPNNTQELPSSNTNTGLPRTGSESTPALALGAGLALLAYGAHRIRRAHLG